MIAALAWRNLWRQPLRSILSVASIAFTAALLVFMLSFQVGVYSVMKTNLLRIFDGFAELQAQGYLADPDMRKTIAKPQILAADLRTIGGVNAASPRIITFAILAHGRRSFGAAVIGVDPANEPLVSSLAATVRRGRYLRPDDDDAAIVGDGLARDLSLSLGDRVTLLGSARDGSIAADVLRIVGIFHSGMGDLDRQMLQMPLARAQATFDLGDRANTIAMAGPTLSGVDDMLPRIASVAARHGVSLADWEALEPSLDDTITLKIITAGLMYATLVVVVVFIILNSLLMSVLERYQEIGIYKSIGASYGDLLVLFLTEAGIIGLLGGSGGLLLGRIVSYGLDVAVNAYARRHGVTEPIQVFVFPAWLLAGTLLFAVLASVLAGVYPALRAARVDPIRALRRG